LFAVVAVVAGVAEVVAVVVEVAPVVETYFDLHADISIKNISARGKCQGMKREGLRSEVIIHQ
jgi:hypothetical protein